MGCTCEGHPHEGVAEGDVTRCILDGCDCQSSEGATEADGAAVLASEESDAEAADAVVADEPIEV